MWRRSWQGPWLVREWEMLPGHLHGITFLTAEGIEVMQIANAHFNPYSSVRRRDEYHVLSHIPTTGWLLLGADHNRADTDGDRLFTPAGGHEAEWRLSPAVERQAWTNTCQHLNLQEVSYEGASLIHRGGRVIGRNDRWHTTWGEVDRYLFTTKQRFKYVPLGSHQGRRRGLDHGYLDIMVQCKDIEDVKQLGVEEVIAQARKACR